MNNLLLKKSVLKVQKILNKFDKKIEIIQLDNTARTALDAANSLKVNTGSIVKSLLFKNTQNNDFILCLVSGDKYISINKLSLIIQNKIKKASADEVKNYTGFSIGGVAPIGHLNTPSKILIDINLKRFDVIYAAAGHPYVIFPISFNKIVQITKGEVNYFTE